MAPNHLSLFILSHVKFLPEISNLNNNNRTTESALIVYQPPPTEPEIIFSDDSLLLVDKPAELLSVPGRRPEHQDCLIARIQQKHPEALIVHRLDMSTSGLMILARGSRVQRQLNSQFEQRLVQKTYLAVVNGRVKQEQGLIDLPLIRDWPNRPRQIVDHATGKAALTYYRVLAYDAETDRSRIELKPVTGRTHQLRVHMQSLGHPILGDDLYANELIQLKANRLMLHASALEFSHPATGEVLIFSHHAPF